MSRLSILIDADDCIFDFLPEFLKAYGKKTGDFANIERITRWDLKEFLEEGDVVDELLSNSELFYDLSLKKYAVDVLTELNEKYDVFIATAGTPKAILGKALAFSTKLPFIKPEQIFYGWDKSRYQADIIVDDSLIHQKSFRATNPSGESIVFDMPHNRKAVFPHYRVSDWEDVYKAIVDIETRRNDYFDKWRI